MGFQQVFQDLGRYVLREILAVQSNAFVHPMVFEEGAARHESEQGLMPALQLPVLQGFFPFNIPDKNAENSSGLQVQLPMRNPIQEHGSAVYATLVQDHSLADGAKIIL